MKLLDTVRRWFSPRGATSGHKSPAQWFIDWVRGDETHTGMSITHETALSYAPVFQAVSVLSGDVATLPLDLYQRTGERSRTRARAHPAYRLVRRTANPLMAASTFRETLMTWALLWGNGCAEILRDNRGRPLQLTPLLPDRTDLKVIEGVVWYLTRVGDTWYRLRPENVLHIKNFGPDGMWGYDTLTLAKNSWGLGLAGEKYAGTYFRNNGTPSGVLKHPAILQDEEYKRLRRDWAEIHEGLDNTARVAILEQGMEFQPLAFTNKDSQWLESRQFQRTEVASWFNLPPHKVGDLSRATFTNIEEQNRDYLNTSLMRWLVKWQDECDLKLTTEREQAEESHYHEFNTGALLRGSIQNRYSVYQTGINARVLNPNECRAMENLDPYEGGDEFLVPLNVGDPGGDPDDSESRQRKPADPPAPDPAQARARAMILARLADLVGVEVERVRVAAASAANFCAWVNSFYGRWQATLAAGLGGDEPAQAIAAAWVATSSQRLVDAAGRTDQANLQATIDRETSAWADVAHGLAVSLLAPQP